MKMGINLMKIKGKMTEKGFTQRELAEILGISIQSLNKKLNGKVEFVISEATKLIEVLDINDPENIFFNINLH